MLDLPDVIKRSGVVDQDVERSEVLLDGREDLANLLAIGHVHLHRRRPATHLTDLLARLLGVHDVLRAEQLRQCGVSLLRGLLELRVRLDQDVGDDDVSAGAGEREAVRPAEAARSPGDDGDLPGQIEHATLLERQVMRRSESLALGPQNRLMTERWRPPDAPAHGPTLGSVLPQPPPTDAGPIPAPPPFTPAAPPSPWLPAPNPPSSPNRRWAPAMAIGLVLALVAVTAASSLLIARAIGNGFPNHAIVNVPSTFPSTFPAPSLPGQP